MPNQARRSDDRRAKIERRQSTTSMMNDFVEYYGPGRRVTEDRRERIERRL